MRVKSKILYSKSVFVNCPFDEAYKPLFRAIVFAVFDAGFVARTSLEYDDASSIRVNKILELIRSCQFGIHDISRTQNDPLTNLPRFNMPLELGAFLGAKVYGTGQQKRKSCLILDTHSFRYQKFISDIAGQDIHGHSNKPKMAVKAVREWLSTNSSRLIPGGDATWERYRQFCAKLPKVLLKIGVNEKELVFNYYTRIIREWLRLNP